MKEYRDIFTSSPADESERLIGCLQFCSFLSLSYFIEEADERRNQDLFKSNDAVLSRSEKERDLRNLSSSSNYITLKTEEQKYLLKSFLKGSLYKGMVSSSYCSSEATTTLVKKVVLVLSRFIEFHEKYELSCFCFLLSAFLNFSILSFFLRFQNQND
jgi:hypothetical protein